MNLDRVRVAYYTDATEVGGAEVSLGYLLSALSGRIEAALVGTTGDVVRRLAACRAGTTSVVLPPIAGMVDVPAMRAHLRAFRRLRPHVLHMNLNTTGASPWATAMGLAVPGVRVVAVEHLPHPIRRLRRRLLARLTDRLLAAHVAVGDSSARDTARFLGIPRSSVRVIHNGIPDVELATLPRPGAGPVVGSLGRLDHQKGYDVLVRALPGLPEVTAVIVGEGKERGALLELADRLGVADRLVLAGWSEEARRHLTTFDVFVLPSRFEGLPLSILEAMLAGLPVVASDVGSVAEAVVDGTTGRLVPPGEVQALSRTLDVVIRDPRLRRRMGDLGRQRALELFTAAAMATRYEALYDEVLS